MSPKATLVLVLAAVLGLMVAKAAVYDGSLVTPDQWHYFTKFCCSNEFPDQPCILTYSLSSSNPGLNLLVYIGYTTNTNGTRDGDWEYTYSHRPGSKDAWSCAQLQGAHKDNGLIPLGNGSVTGNVPMKQYVRAYYWFMALADCSAPSGLNINHYHLDWVNPGGFWYQQFSYDQQGLAIIYIFYSAFYICLAAAHGYAVWQQFRSDQWHPVIRVLTVAIGVGLLGVLAETLHYLVYAGNGIGIPGVLGFGDLMGMASQVVLMFQCILIAKGWAITTSYLSEKYIVLVVMGLFVIAYLALFIWDKAAPNPESTLYFYDSIPGIIVAVLRVLTCAWFLWNLRNTIRLESLPEKRTFYIVFGAAYTLWFLLLPLIVLIAAFLAPWVRFRIITAMMITSDFLGLSALAFLMWPSRAANYFVIKASPQLLSVKSGGGYGTSSAYDATNAL